jgi:hypothetical protein
MTDANYIISSTPTAANATTADTVGIPSHNAGDLIIIQQRYFNGDNTGFIDTIPPGFIRVPNGQSKASNSAALQALFYKIDTAGTTTSATIGRTATTAASQMQGAAHIVRGSDASTVFGTGPAPVNNAVQGTGPTAHGITFPAAPAGSLMMVFASYNSASGTDITSAWTNGFTTVQTAGSTPILRTAYRANAGAVASTTTTTASVSGAKFYSLVGATIIKTASVLSTSNGVAAVTSTTQALLGSASSKEEALNDADDTTGISEVVNGTGDPIVLQMAPVATPTGTQGYTVTFTVDRDGGSGGTWLVELIEGGVTRGSVTKASNGTSTETLQAVFTQAMVSSVSAGSAYWEAGPVIRITPTISV